MWAQYERRADVKGFVCQKPSEGRSVEPAPTEVEDDETGLLNKKVNSRCHVWDEMH